MDLKPAVPLILFTLYFTSSWAKYSEFIAKGSADIKVSSSERCYRVFRYTTECSSVEWNKLSKICRLNKGANSRDPSSSLMLNAVFNSLETLRGPCMERPCRIDQVCVPVTRSTAFVCLLAQTTTKRTTSTQPPISPESRKSTTAGVTTSASSVSKITTVASTSTSVSTTTAESTSVSFASTTTITTTLALTSTFVSTSTTTADASTSVLTASPTAIASTSASSLSTSTSTEAPTSTTTEAPTSTTTEAPTSTTTEAPTSTTTEASTSTSVSSTTTAACSGCTDEGGEAQCVEGVCKCRIGFGWDKERKLCRLMNECKDLANAFDVYPGHFIEGNNILEYYGRCDEQCFIHGCYTMDLGTRCYLQKVFWYDVQESSRSVPPSSLDQYQRRCDRWN